MLLKRFRENYFDKVFAHFDWTVKLLVVLLILDLIVVSLHVFLGDWTTYFHLDHEHNFPTIYQSLKILTAGYITLFSLIQFWPTLSTYKKWLLAPLSILFIFFGLDELGQIHESVDRFVREMNPDFADGLLVFAQNAGYVSSTWILYYLPLFMLVGMYGLFIFYYILKRQRHHFPTLLFTSFVIFLIQVFEFVSNQGQVDSLLYEQFIVREELAEMIGLSLAAFFAIQFQRDVVRDKSV